MSKSEIKLRRQVDIKVNVRSKEQLEKAIEIFSAEKPEAEFLSLNDLLAYGFIDTAEYVELKKAIRDPNKKQISIKSIIPKGLIKNE